MERESCLWGGFRLAFALQGLLHPEVGVERRDSARCPTSWPEREDVRIVRAKITNLFFRDFMDFVCEIWELLKLFWRIVRAIGPPL